MYAGHHTATLTAAASRGRGQARSSEAIVPFRINVPEHGAGRLEGAAGAHAFPERDRGSGWDYGTNLAYLKELVTYWRTKFDWREQERQLNQLPQFKTTIDGVEIHFVHQRSSRPDATPLVFDPRLARIVFRSHEDHRTADRAGGSRRPRRRCVRRRGALAAGLWIFRQADASRATATGGSPSIIAQLMARLGYTRYGAQGGDWGGFIVRQLGLVDPQHLIGLHSNFCLAGRTAGVAESERGRAGRGDASALDAARARIRERDRPTASFRDQAADARLLV